MNTDITSNTNPASTKQISFLSDLLASKECDTEYRDELFSLIYEEQLDKRVASAAIEKLISAPKRKDATPSPMQTLLASVPKSKYAVPTEMLMGSDIEDSFKGDLIFLELKEFMGNRYLRQLFGSPGGFARLRLSADQVKYLIDIIAEDPYKYARVFGNHYTCCGSGGAELTDVKSRELMLGPECRKKFGL
jgi:hypothetical protein